VLSGFPESLVLREFQRLNKSALTDTAEQMQETELAELWLDLAHHQFWRSEAAGMRYLIPRFVFGWQYDRAWTRSLLEITESFHACLKADCRKRLARFEQVLSFDPDLDIWSEVLADLDKLNTRQQLKNTDDLEVRSILLLKKGQYLCRIQRYSEALDSYFKIEDRQINQNLELRIALADALNGVAWKFALNERTAVPSSEAERALEKAVKLDPQNGHHSIALGVALYGLKKHEEATQKLEMGIQLEGPKSYSLNWLGNVYCNQGRYKEAINVYQQAITLDPEYAYPQNGLGNAYYNQGRYEEAINAYQQAITLDPKYAYPQNGLGNVYYNQGRYEEAINAYQQVIILDPEDAASSHNNLGEVYLLQNQFPEAEKSLLSAIKLGGERYNRAHAAVGGVVKKRGCRENNHCTQ
jgi:tetratricopeptide (TPR) repeat protein